MTKITQTLRDHILRAAIDDAFNVREQALNDEQGALALALADRMVPPAERKAATVLGTRWIPSERRVQVNIGGERRRLSLPENGGPGLLVPLAASAYRHSQVPAWSLPADDELAVAIRANGDALEALATARKDAYDALRSLLASVNTLKQLTTLWPEGAAYYRAPPAPTSLVSCVDAVNSALGLPKDADV